MAGAFGYEKEHYRALRRRWVNWCSSPMSGLLQPKPLSVAPGTSCRHHVKDGTGRIALHPAEVLFAALRGG
ncbi:MAG: hypothetical protein MZV63_22810 [Marinilabiliales bacterium]|nr:hypothetical protein [Marinilabiliales bacterium]